MRRLLLVSVVLAAAVPVLAVFLHPPYPEPRPPARRPYNGYLR